MIEKIISRYPKDQSSLVMVLQDVQTEFGYLPAEALGEAALELGVPQAHVYSVATFYDVLSLEPRGRHLLRVCMGTACHVRQSSLLLDTTERDLGVKEGDTTEDGEFTVLSVGCVGACAIGPVVEIDGEQRGNMTVGRLSRTIRGLKKRNEE